MTFRDTRWTWTRQRPQSCGCRMRARPRTSAAIRATRGPKPAAAVALGAPAGGTTMAPRRPTLWALHHRSPAPEPALYGSGADTRSHGGGSSFDRERAGGSGGPGGGYDREPRGGPRPGSRATGFSDRPVGGYPERSGDGPERGSVNLFGGPGRGFTGGLLDFQTALSAAAAAAAAAGQGVARAGGPQVTIAPRCAANQTPGTLHGCLPRATAGRAVADTETTLRRGHGVGSAGRAACELGLLRHAGWLTAGSVCMCYSLTGCMLRGTEGPHVAMRSILLRICVSSVLWGGKLG